MQNEIEDLKKVIIDQENKYNDIKKLGIKLKNLSNKDWRFWRASYAVTLNKDFPDNNSISIDPDKHLINESFRAKPKTGCC